MALHGNGTAALAAALQLAQETAAMLFLQQQQVFMPTM
jgi:hypothetical protein